MNPISSACPLAPWQATAQPRVFWIGTLGIFITGVIEYQKTDVLDLIGFLLIATTALLPAFLWCQRLAHGVPIYPVFVIGTIWTFALPLISRHPLVIQYEPMERITAAVTIAFTNLSGTALWFYSTRRLIPLRTFYYGFRPGSGDLLFLVSMAVAVIFTVITNSYALDWDASIVSFFRAIIMALANLAIFVLGYQFGQQRLTFNRCLLYCFLLALLILATLPSALMVLGLSYSLVGIIGFALGKGRIPWLILALLIGTTLFLHAGKTAIREKYWFSSDATLVTPSHFPEFMSDWIQFSTASLLRNQVPQEIVEENGPQSFTERASLMHLFLRIQRMTPRAVPYLQGETYAIIPQLLVPRFFNVQKSWSHQGIYLLAVHYDLQREEDTRFTTIGFGLINEALANFGYLGCLLLGTALGGFYGLVARWSASYPLLSFRSLFTILVLTVSFQNEFTAGVFVTTLFQGTCALIMLSVVAMVRVSVYSASPISPLLKWEQSPASFSMLKPG